jgi:hypothetical protein
LNAFAERFVGSAKSECLERIVPLGEGLSFARTGAALLSVTIAASRELIALMIAMVARPERSAGMCVRSHVGCILTCTAQPTKSHQAARRS